MTRHHATWGPGLVDVRRRTLALTAIAIAAGGIMVAVMSGEGPFGRLFSITEIGSGAEIHATDPTRQEIHRRFQQGVVMLHAKQHEHAMTAFHRVLELDPALPEAHVNMGFALIGMERYGAARDFFESAIALRKEQANAYYGLAVALDGLRDRPGAIGAMRTFIHLSAPESPYARKALAALWEWETERATEAATQKR